MFSWKFSKKEEKVELKAEVPIVEEIEQVKALTDLADEALSKAANSVARGLVIDAICTYAGLKIKEEYEFSGYKVSRTGKGHDLKAEKKDWLL